MTEKPWQLEDYVRAVIAEFHLRNEYSPLGPLDIVEIENIVEAIDALEEFVVKDEPWHGYAKCPECGSKDIHESTPENKDILVVACYACGQVLMDTYIGDA